MDDAEGGEKSNKFQDDTDVMPSFTGVMNSVLKTFISSVDGSQQTEWDEADEYNVNHLHRGVAMVIINDTFSGHTNRKGSEFDSQNLCRTFSSLGFEVRSAINCSLKELKHILESVAEEDHTDEDCFVLALSSHGDEEVQKAFQGNKQIRQDIVFCNDGYMTTGELTSYFSDSKSPTLKGKPRLFFLQACRGSKFDAGQDIKVMHCGKEPEIFDEVDGPVMPNVVVSPAPCYKDSLIMYGTPPGYFAFRRPSDGSWFLQALCSVLEKCDGSQSIMQLLTRVVGVVAHEYQSFTPLQKVTHGKKQTPCIYSMLTKDLYLKVVIQKGKVMQWR